jgi:hypothetical protein
VPTTSSIFKYKWLWRHAVFLPPHLLTHVLQPKHNHTRSCPFCRFESVEFHDTCAARLLPSLQILEQRYHLPSHPIMCSTTLVTSLFHLSKTESDLTHAEDVAVLKLFSTAHRAYTLQFTTDLLVVQIPATIYH